jgi:hypothetical protein
MAPRRMPKRAVWRRHRVWPWALAAVALVLLVGLQLARRVVRPPAPVAAAGGGSFDVLLPDGGGPAEHRGRLGVSFPTVAVLDAHGAPVSGCVVELRVPGDALESTGSTTAEACDAVELPGVPPGDYLLRAEAPGYRRGERPVHLAPGPSPLALSLAEGVALSGQVVDADGRPVPGVSVVVFPTEAATRTNAAGAFVVGVPGAGSYSLEVQHSDWGGAVLTLTAPGAPVVLKLEPHSVLQLQVRSGGQPVEGAQALLLQGPEAGATRQYAADRTTDADGGVRLQGFPEGTYTLQVSRPGAASQERREVVLHEGAPTALTVSLPPVSAGVLEGLVVDEAGQPVASARVRASPGDVASAQSDAQGRFRLPGLAEGIEYTVVAEWDGAPSSARRAHAGESGLRLVMPRPRVYRGRVLDEAQKPVPAFRIGDVQVEADSGRFALPLSARRGTVSFTVEAPPLALATVVRPADVEDLGDLVLHSSPLVEGRVHETDGGPAAGALVVCEGCRSEGSLERHLTAFADADGRFTLAMTGPSGVLVRLLAMKDGRLGWGEAGRVGEAARLTLAAPSLARGRVRRPDGRPAPGVAVVFSEPLLEAVLVVTGPDGSFAGDVPPGLYQLTLLPDTSRPRRTWTVQLPLERPLELVTGAVAP